ncbi:MAG: OmpA family protein [Lewinellaceae bacterium]|nr:OmpA family protein [Lewinellaceae bacterium]
MSTTTRAILVVAAFLLYMLGLVQFCSRDICERCGIGATAEATVPPPPSTDENVATPQNRFPLASLWDRTDLFTGPGSDSLLAAVQAGKKADNILEIVGLYYPEEKTPAKFENMGLARAEAIRSRFFADIPAARIQLRARAMEADADTRTNYFASGIFNWLAPEKTVSETVEELEDRIIIRFPFNSTEKEYDPKVDDYLDRLAKRLVQSGEAVRLSGHTDNIGEADANLALADRRAKAIRDILRKKGVSANQITTESFGESQPVASNDTDAGRHENRRVELRLIKKQ